MFRREAIAEEAYNSSFSANVRDPSESRLHSCGPLVRRLAAVARGGGPLGRVAFSQDAIEFRPTYPKQFCRAHFVSTYTLQRPQRMGSFHLFERRKDVAILRSEEHTSELQSLTNLVCRLLLEKKKNKQIRDSM